VWSETFGRRRVEVSTKFESDPLSIACRTRRALLETYVERRAGRVLGAQAGRSVLGLAYRHGRSLSCGVHYGTRAARATLCVHFAQVPVSVFAGRKVIELRSASIDKGGGGTRLSNHRWFVTGPR